MLKPRGSCSTTRQWVIEGREGFLPSSIVSDGICGSMASPLVINALPWQRINLTFYNFDTRYLRNSNHGTRHDQDSQCDKSVHIVDEMGGKNVAACRNSQGVQHLYTSANHSLKVIFSRGRDKEAHGRYLLHFKGKLKKFSGTKPGPNTTVARGLSLPAITGLLSIFVIFCSIEIGLGYILISWHIGSRQITDV